MRGGENPAKYTVTHARPLLTEGEGVEYEPRESKGL